MSSRAPCRFRPHQLGHLRAGHLREQYNSGHGGSDVMENAVRARKRGRRACPFCQASLSGAHSVYTRVQCAIQRAPGHSFSSAVACLSSTRPFRYLLLAPITQNALKPRGRPGDGDCRRDRGMDPPGLGITILTRKSRYARAGVGSSQSQISLSRPAPRTRGKGRHHCCCDPESLFEESRFPFDLMSNGPA